MKRSNNKAFITPYNKPSYKNKMSKSGKKDTSSSIKKSKMNLANKANSRNALDISKQLLSLSTTPSEIVAARIAFGALENGLKSLANNSAKMLPYYFQQSTSNVDDTKIHIVRFNVGRESTVGVKSARNTNGSSNIQLSDSLSQCQSEQSRIYLSRSFGFNQKSFDFLGPNFYMCVKDYQKLFNLSSWKIPTYGTNVPYGLALEEFSNVRIRNSNTYHKLKFNIHLIKILDDDISIEKLYNHIVNDSPLKQDDDAMPMVYQISDKDKGTNRPIKSVLCYKGFTLSKADSFATQALDVKTFSKVLKPGDTFDFRMIHHMGPGIRLDHAQKYMNAGAKGDQPSGYGIIVEAEGTLCQGMRLSDKAVFQGSCPGWYNYEYTKGVKLVKSDQLSTSVDTDENSLKYAVKTYEREYLENRPITFNSNDIGRPDEKGKVFTILSTSKEHVVFGSNISDTVSTQDSNSIELETDFGTLYDNEIQEDFND